LNTYKWREQYTCQDTPLSPAEEDVQDALEEYLEHIVGQLLAVGDED